MNIISNCPLCEEHALHVIGEKDELMQCLYCGYVSSQKFIGTINDNNEYKKLPEQMQKMAKEYNGRIWIPSVLTLPMGVLTPILVEGDIFWSFAPMIDIPEDEQKNYPDGNGGFYVRRYDTKGTKLFKEFNKALVELNDEYTPKEKELTLPKLKRID
jgi:hypothetical protein